MSAMRAWQVKGQGEPRDVLALVEAELPEPGPGQIRMRVLVAGVGLPDVYMCRGSYALTPERPFTPGQELVGIVTALGEGALARIGERRMATSSFHLRHGSFAQECLAGDDFAMPVPDAMPDAEAAGFMIPYHTAWLGLVQRARLAPNENLLVLGAAGGSGAAAVLLGKALGARVIATAGGAEKVAFCRTLGADEVIDYRSQEIAESTRRATGGRGADVVYDPVGGSAFSAATKCIAHEGRILAVGFASGSWGQVVTPHLVARSYSVLGVMPSAAYDRAFKERAHAALLDHWKAGRVRVPLHRVFPFSEVPAAIEEVAAGKMMGKVVVEVDGER
jgi:NADPH2:quinone reductase